MARFGEARGAWRSRSRRPVAIRITFTALPMTSAGRLLPFGSLAIQADSLPVHRRGHVNSAAIIAFRRAYRNALRVRVRGLDLGHGPINGRFLDVNLVRRDRPPCFPLSVARRWPSRPIESSRTNFKLSHCPTSRQERIRYPILSPPMENQETRWRAWSRSDLCWLAHGSPRRKPNCSFRTRSGTRGHPSSCRSR